MFPLRRREKEQFEIYLSIVLLVRAFPKKKLVNQSLLKFFQSITGLGEGKFKTPAHGSHSVPSREWGKQEALIKS